MDIVVTIPKNEVSNFEQEISDMHNDSDLIKKYKLARYPKQLSISDYIYFVCNQAVQYKARVTGIDSESFECETSGRKWAGCFVNCQEIEKIQENTFIDGFQGFRYRWW